MRYKAVLFDLGSTLIEYENKDWTTLGKIGIAKAYPNLKKRFPMLPELSSFGSMFYEYFKDILDGRKDYEDVELHDICASIFQRMNLDMSDGVIAEFVTTYYKPIRDQLTLIEGADVILEKFKNVGLTIGLVSNSIFPERFHLTEMEQFGLLKYFDFTIFSSSVKTRKPGKEIFDMALKKANITASEAIFVGDRFDADIAGAINAGIVSVWKYRAGRENPDGVEPDHSIIKLEELETIVLR